MNAVSSSMNIVGYRHDNSALTEQRVAQILSEARAAMKAVDTPQTKVCYYHLSYCHSSYLSPFHSFFDIVSWAVPKVSPLGSWQPGVTGKVWELNKNDSRNNNSSKAVAREYWYYHQPQCSCQIKFGTELTRDNLAGFYTRDAMHRAVFVTVTCLSVCPSHAGIVSKRRDFMVSSPSESPNILVFGVTPSEGDLWGWGGYKLAFLVIFDL